MFLLDTNACIHILNNSSREVVARFERESPATIRLCSVVKAKLLYGARKSRAVAKTLASLERFLAPLPSLSFDDRCAHEYGRLRADLELAGTPIGANNLWIAAHALASGLILVSNNLREFGRVTGLATENRAH